MVVRIILHGAYGKMGQTVAAVAGSRDDVEIVAGVDMAADGRQSPFPVFSALSACHVEADGIIDFSMPEALPGLLDGALQKKLPLVIATTGLTEPELAQVRRAAEWIPILQSANMSLGVNLISELAQKSAVVLGENFDIEIIEKHHNLKKDAPSGTAYAIANAINEVLLSPKRYVFGRQTRTDRRTPQDLGIHAIRAGTIVGEHTVLFAGKDEIVEVTHRAASRQIFAAGALRAVGYLQGKPPRLYNMKDMITEQSAVTNLYTSGEEALITVHHISDDPQLITRIFQGLGEGDINIDMISQTAPENGTVNISFTLFRRDVEKAVTLLEGFRQDHPRLRVSVLEEIMKITVEGVGMERQSGVAARVFALMADLDIRIKTITTSETKIAYIIDRKDSERAVKAIREAFGI